MNEETVILLAEDDKGHAGLIKRGLRRASINNRIINFIDGQEVLDFLLHEGPAPRRENGESYVLLLDIRMPRVDGIEVLRTMKLSDGLSKVPVIIVSTTDNEETMQMCLRLGCEKYVVKPVDYEEFQQTISDLALNIKTLISS